VNIVHGIINVYLCFGVLNFLHSFYYLSIRLLLHIVENAQTVH